MPPSLIKIGKGIWMKVQDCIELVQCSYWLIYFLCGIRHLFWIGGPLCKEKKSRCFSSMNTTKVQTSYVSSHDLYWGNKTDKRKRSIKETRVKFWFMMRQRGKKNLLEQSRGVANSTYRRHQGQNGTRPHWWNKL